MSGEATRSQPASLLALATFRLNGSLIALGDEMTRDTGLSSARWQVLGAIVEAGTDLSMSGIARQMGLVRQSVRRIVNDLVAEDLLALIDDPADRRAKVVRLTTKGQEAYAEANAHWGPLADQLEAAAPQGDLERATRLLTAMRAVADDLTMELRSKGHAPDHRSPSI